MKLIKSLAVVILLLVFYSVTLANHSLDDSVTVAKLDQEIASLTHANAILSAHLAGRGSLTQAAALIEALGYTTPEQVVTLTGPSSVASR